MTAPTYDLIPLRNRPGRYLDSVRRLAEDVIASGQRLRGVVADYGEFVASTRRESRRTDSEYLLEALLLGVLWRARGAQVDACTGPRAALVTLLSRERRDGAGRRRDGSTALLLPPGVSTEPGRPDPTRQDFERLIDWLLGSGEYDDEVQRLQGWEAFLRRDRNTADAVLRMLVGFAIEFEALSHSSLRAYTTGVPRFLCKSLPSRKPREDTLQCSRKRIEYHFNMVGAEILNRAWRTEFLARRRHVLVLPGCSRRRPDGACAARRGEVELECSHCMTGCAASAATLAAERAGAEAFAVIHGSDFSQFLRSPRLSGGDVGIVGVACAPGLVGAGWRARAEGLPAQCVLLDSSGCTHWCDEPVSTHFDLKELRRILRTDACRPRCRREAVHGQRVGVDLQSSVLIGQGL